MSIDPPQADRIKEFFLFYLLKIAEQSDIKSASGGFNVQALAGGDKSGPYTRSSS
jgi:hypothetical protein